MEVLTIALVSRTKAKVERRRNKLVCFELSEYAFADNALICRHMKVVRPS